MAVPPKSRPITTPVVSAHLACGCQVGFRPGTDGSPVGIVVERKAPGCAMAIHVAGLPVYDHREALRPPTRVAPPAYTDDYGDS